MKKLMLAGVIAVGLIGTSNADNAEQCDFVMPMGQAGWRTVADASVELVKDTQLQVEAEKSIKKIVAVLQKFALFGLKKVAEKSDAQGKENLKELLGRLELLLEKFAPAIERDDMSALDEKAQEECQQLIQELEMFALPLIIMLDQSDLNDGALIKSLRAELVVGVRSMIVHMNDELK